MNTDDLINGLRREMAQLIYLLEDSVILGNNESVFMNIGKLSKIQTLLDQLEDNPKEWRNVDDDY